MTRVSLKEAYDNKDVVAQIYAIRDIAEGAEDIANGAVSTADTASEHVDLLVPQVEGAVQTANNASASAQQSATTVEGYDARLTELETKNTQQDTAISALQTADGQNVKLGTPQNITGRKTIVENYPRLDFKSKHATDAGSGLRLLDTADGSQKQYLYLYPDRIDISSPAQGAPSSAIVNKAYVESTDGVTNNLMHRTTNEKVDGIKTFVQRVDFDSSTVDLNNPPSYASRGMSQVNTGPNLDVVAMREEMLYSSGGNTLQFIVYAHGEDEAHTDHTATLMLTVFRDGTARLRLVRESGTVEIVPRG